MHLFEQVFVHQRLARGNKLLVGDHLLGEVGKVLDGLGVVMAKVVTVEIPLPVMVWTADVQGAGEHLLQLVEGDERCEMATDVADATLWPIVVVVEGKRGVVKLHSGFFETFCVLVTTGAKRKDNGNGRNGQNHLFDKGKMLCHIVKLLVSWLKNTNFDIIGCMKRFFLIIFAPISRNIETLIMKKLFLFVSLVALALTGIQAGPVDQQKAQQLGTLFMSNTELAQRDAAIQLQLVSTAATRGATDYYVFNVTGGEGFVIIAGDDRVKPVLAYSTTGRFNPQDVSEGFAYTLRVFQQEIQNVRDYNLVATPDIVAEWQSLKTTGNIRKGRAARSVVGPLCQTIWNQNFPWNSQCPDDTTGSGGHVYAGCVATAMGQVMKYWNYPERGTGSHTYTPEGYPSQTANFGATDYHFELMPLELDSTSTEEDYFYIAQFLHHCGIAVDMMYGGNGSGAYSGDVPPALQNYFGYSTEEFETLGYWGFNFYTNERGNLSLAVWLNYLKGELDEGAPFMYGGSGNYGGHVWVCDGYQDDDYFHFNWGWGGQQNAYFTLTNCSSYGFNSNHAIIIGIRGPEVPSAISEHDGEKATVFPNPTNGIVYVRAESQPVLELQVFDMFGRKLSHKNVGENEFSVDLSNYNAGTYILRLISKTGVETRKIVKN